VRLIRWTTEAADEFEAAVKHIQQHNPTAGRNVAQAVIDGIQQLATFPGIGRPGEVKGTRELVSSPYVVVSRSTEEIVEILHFWHGAQDWRRIT
jgi:plasmid stabilization system protein ParE